MININDIIFFNFNTINSFNLFLFITLSLILSLAIDLIFGELPTKIHPVVIIGSIISFFKKKY